MASETSPTVQLAQWIASTQYSVPDDVRTRAKHLILDGIACLLIGPHLPWSEKATRAIMTMDPIGYCTIAGWERKTSPLSAALINSTFIQGFELDDWHSEAPLHSNAILIPTLLALCEHLAAQPGGGRRTVTGEDFLDSMIVGYEVGPRVGRGLWGPHILSAGWHSGAVFGPSASAAAASRLLRLDAGAIEDALGIACTQACGLMSAQFESEVKRMQHGFAARNGLLGALLAKEGYVGIKKVYEREYGGFLKQFSLGNGKEPQYLPDEICKGLGETWKTMGVNLKPYASMAGTHSTVDCVRRLQDEHPEAMKKPEKMKKITISMGEAAFHHGGWKATRPLTATGAQMSNSFVCATQILDRQVLVQQFHSNKLQRDVLWNLVDVTDCVQALGEGNIGHQRVTIEFQDGQVISAEVKNQKGVNPPLSNEEIVAKYDELAKEVIDKERSEKIKLIVLELESCTDMARLGELLSGLTKNPIA